MFGVSHVTMTTGLLVCYRSSGLSVVTMLRLEIKLFVVINSEGDVAMLCMGVGENGAIFMALVTEREET